MSYYRRLALGDVRRPSSVSILADSFFEVCLCFYMYCSDILRMQIQTSAGSRCLMLHLIAVTEKIVIAVQRLSSICANGSCADALAVID